MANECASSHICNRAYVGQGEKLRLQQWLLSEQLLIYQLPSFAVLSIRLYSPEYDSSNHDSKLNEEARNCEG